MEKWCTKYIFLFSQALLHFQWLSLVKAQDPSSWTTLAALAQSSGLLTAHTTELELKTASTLRTLVCAAKHQVLGSTTSY